MKPRIIAEVMLPGDPLVDGAILVALISRHDGCAARVEPYRAELQEVAHTSGDRRLDEALQRACQLDWRELVPTLRANLERDGGAHDDLLAAALAQALHDDMVGSSGDPAIERDYLRWSSRLPPRHRPFPSLPPRSRLLAALELIGDLTSIRVDSPLVAEAQGALEAAAWDEGLPLPLAGRLADLLELLRTGWVDGRVVRIGPGAALAGILLDDAYRQRLVAHEGEAVIGRIEHMAARIPLRGAAGTTSEVELFLDESELNLARTLTEDYREWRVGLTARILALDVGCWPATAAALMAPPG